MFSVRPMFAALLCVLVLSVQSPAAAVALRPNKATDDSVCDLGNNTNSFLGRAVLVPAVAARTDQIDAFFRLAATFVATKCSDGQVLILQGSSEVDIDALSLSQVANSACLAASVIRTEMSLASGDRSTPGFELRCKISKREELENALERLENRDPMDSLRSRLAAAVRNAESGNMSSTTGPGPTTKRDCAKITLATLLRGGGCP